MYISTINNGRYILFDMNTEISKTRKLSMPLTITLTEGVIPEKAEAEAVKRITDAILKWHGLTGNKVMTPNITAHVNVLPRSRSYAGGEPFDGAWIEIKIPSFAFTDREIQKGLFAEATDIIVELSGGKQPRDKIFSNVIYAVDGTWNLDGRAMTNAELGESIALG